MLRCSSCCWLQARIQGANLPKPNGTESPLSRFLRSKPSCAKSAPFIPISRVVLPMSFGKAGRNLPPIHGWQSRSLKLGSDSKGLGFVCFFYNKCKTTSFHTDHTLSNLCCFIPVPGAASPEPRASAEVPRPMHVPRVGASRQSHPLSSTGKRRDEG